MTQQLVATLLVGCASLYCAWTLMPVSWRAGLRRRLGLGVPAAASGCGGCGGGCAKTSAAASGTAVIHLHRRPVDAGVKAASARARG
jgi:hypothetical protein